MHYCHLQNNILKLGLLVSTFYIEHDMKLVLGICERLVVLNYGKILASGKPNDVINNPQVVEAYLGKEEDE